MPQTDNARQWTRVLPLLDEALELEPAQREAWLTALASRDAGLAAQLRELLALHTANSASGFMERSPLDAGEDLAGRQIGPYGIERLLGRGGMGSVWLGRRNDGKFEGRAALKVLERRGLGSDAERHIRREASLLARLSHAHIARLFDAGVRENGQPYLILEYVEGEPIDRYCRAQALTLRARLRLFLAVLDAVAHAHANLVVHRDLKPSNVLVTPEGVVKLLDFGVASLQAAGQAPGDEGAPQALTPGYAAPEQLRGEPVAAVADVYALGVLLHVLVTGAHPFGASGATHTELMRATLTEDPAPASGRLVDAAERRRVHGDLDAIIARALSRDPALRYATAAEFAADLRAYLENLPVRARPATRAYLARKFAQRHWGGVLSVVLTLLVLLSATVVTTLQTLEARRQRDFARAQLERAEALNDLNRYVLFDAAPGETFTAKQLLERARHVLERQKTTDPNRIALLTSVGFGYEAQDDHAAGKKILAEAYELSHRTADPSARANAACALANSLANEQYTPRSAALIEEGLRDLPAAPEFALDRYFCLSRAEQIAKSAGDVVLAIRRGEQALRALDDVPFAHELVDVYAYEELASALGEAGRYQEANAAYANAWPRLAALGRDDTSGACTLLSNWATVVYHLGRPLEAERLLRQCLDIEHTNLSTSNASPMLLANYALMLYELDRLDAAADYARRAYQLGTQASNRTVINQARLRLAGIYGAQGNFAQAEHVLDDAEQSMRQQLAPGHYAYGAIDRERALLAQRQGRTADALASINRAIGVFEKAAQSGKAGGQYVPRMLSYRASIELDAGQFTGAETDVREALRSFTARDQPGDYSIDTGRAYLTLARILNGEGRGSEARNAAQQAAQQLTKAAGPAHPETRAAQELARTPAG